MKKKRKRKKKGKKIQAPKRKQEESERGDDIKCDFERSAESEKRKKKKRRKSGRLWEAATAAAISQLTVSSPHFKKYSSVCVCVMQTTAVVAHRKPFVAKALKLVPTTASTASASTAAAFIRQIELGRHTMQYQCPRHIATGISLPPPPPICIVCSIAPHNSPSP